jgi:hypothetical protein
LAKRKPKSRRSQPLVPFTDEYIWVQTKESSFWRRKRGTVKPAELNEAFKNNVSLARQTGPAAKRIVSKLGPFIYNLETGRVTLHISNLLMKTMNSKGSIDFSLFKDFDIQERFPFPVPYNLQVGKDELTVSIDIHEYTLEYKSSLITDYYFELILLHGDPMKERSLRTESVESRLYPFDPKGKKSTCTLTMELPTGKQPWMIFLKLSCLEGNEAAIHPRHYGMKVVAVG